MEALDIQSDAADLTFERFKAALGGAGSYPKGAIFVDAEAPFAGSAVVRNMREGQAVVLVYPDGLERLVEPVSMGGSRSILAAATRGFRSKLLTLFL